MIRIPMSSDMGREIDGDDDMNVLENSARGGKYYNLQPSNRTPSDGTPSGGYQRRCSTRGFGAKQQREDMIENVRNERTETEMKIIHLLIEQSKK